MSPVAIVVAVGPADGEVERLRDLAASIVHHDSGPATFVLVDDAPQSRLLDKQLSLPVPFDAVSLHHPRHGSKAVYRKGKGICSAILLALQWIARHRDPAFVLKLDTDSLVISPFRDRLNSLFASQSELGMVGAYTLTPNGTTRDWSMHVQHLTQLARLFEWRRPLQSFRAARDPTRQHVAKLLRTARANGYTYGEHCMGGGYALSAPLLRQMNLAGYLDDPSLWMSVDLPEDVMVGLHVRATGFEFANSVGEGEVFGVRFMGLAGSPAELLAKGYSVIHAVKNDKVYDEETIRAFFKSHREGSTSQG